MTRPVGARGKAATLALAGIVAFAACGDPYLHTNPYDPAVPVQMTIAGPDTLFSLGEIAQYSATTAPVFPDSAIGWAVDSLAQVSTGDGVYENVYSGSFLSAQLNTGSFQSLNPPLEPATALVKINANIAGIDTIYQIAIPGTDPVLNQTIREKFYRHYTSKTVVVTQRVTRIQLRCPASHACDTVSAGGTWSVWVDGFDALGRQIVALTSSTANPLTGTPVVLYTVRDTTIARSAPNGIRTTNVTALKSGTTWVVATRGALSDSLKLVVQ